MFFFYGTNTSIISSTPLAGVPCAHCGTVGSVFATVYSRYLHFFWIPVLPLGKKAVSMCQHCQQVLTPEQMPPAYQQPVQALQQQGRVPVSNYLITILLGCVLALIIAAGVVGFFTSRKDRSNTKRWLTDPQVGDIYALYNPDSHYSLLHVARVGPDSLYFEACAYRPRYRDDINEHRDSVLLSRTPRVQPMSRTAVQSWQKADILTIMR